MQKKSENLVIGALARGVAQSGVRIANERAVLGLIAIGPGSSNADVARISGLGAQTTSRIVAELESRGLVLRGQVLRGRRGQPATPLFINPKGAFAIGVEIGWHHFDVILVDMAGVTATTVRRTYDWPDAKTLFSVVAADVEQLRATLSPELQQQLVGIGLATPTGLEKLVHLLGAPAEQVDLWREIDIAKRLTEVTGLEVQRFNDGHAATWAELIAQPHPRRRDFVYFQLGSAVAGGIVIDGGFAEGDCRSAELGSLMICDGITEPTFIHMVASLDALRATLKEEGIVVPAAAPSQWDWAAIEHIVGPWVDQAALALAKGIASVRAVLDIEAVIFDGPMPDALLDRIIARTNQDLERLPVITHRPPPVVRGHVGASAAGSGAAQLLLFDRFFSRGWNLMAT
jgi:predicted NBD/HSP70 family sugar kinase